MIANKQDTAEEKNDDNDSEFYCEICDKYFRT